MIFFLKLQNPEPDLATDLKHYWNIEIVNQVRFLWI